VRAERLDYDETGVPRSALEELAQCAVLSFDGALYSMHEAVRRFYYGRASEETRRRYHRIAMAYYDREYDEMEKRGVRNPSTLAELAYHAGMTGDAALTSRLRKLVIEELKPAARQIYREDRDYWRALKLYRTIADITPDDPEVIAYVGRCYARLGSWEESDKAFARAIEIAGRKKDDWWIYRDWGHILARYAFYSRAQECFCIAEERRSRDASISAALGYMHWRVGDVDSACERFEEALQINPNHGYTLSYYARLLDELGQHDRAEGMRDRLRTIESWTRPPSEHDIDLGAEDLEDL
jgi:tetratricopeptide (TPR) repeat protein